MAVKQRKYKYTDVKIKKVRKQIQLLTKHDLCLRRMLFSLNMRRITLNAINAKSVCSRFFSAKLNHVKHPV